MDLRPILSALMRNKTSAFLVAFQIALTLAILCNALFIVSQRLELMNRPSGMNESDTFMFSSSGFGDSYDALSVAKSDLALLRRLPGVAAATGINTVPLRDGGWAAEVYLQPHQKTPTAVTAIYDVDENGIDTLGATLVAGRNFKPEEVVTKKFTTSAASDVIIVTRALAQKLFPDSDAVGRLVYLDEQSPPSLIVGVLDRLQQPWAGNENVEDSVLLPVSMPFGNFTRYLVRSEPGRRDEVQRLVESKLAESNTSRILSRLRSTVQTRSDAYEGDRAMAIILMIVVVALLTITALGIVGMASFWVSQRTRQIGTRRALGATRANILSYFHKENFIITTIGVVIGGLMTCLLNLWLIAHYQSGHLPWQYIAAGALSIWLLGQIAVFGPALRAAQVPPAVATRSI